MVFFVIRTWPGSIPRNLIVSTSQSPGLNHSAILTPKKYSQMPAPYRIADVFEANATYHMDFLCGDKMYELVIDPTQLNREYLTVRWP